MSGVTGGHHVLGVEHLLGELRDGDSSVLHGAPGGEGSEPRHEEVEAREGDHVNGQLAKVCVQLARESKTRGHSCHELVH